MELPLFRIPSDLCEMCDWHMDWMGALVLYHILNINKDKILFSKMKININSLIFSFYTQADCFVYLCLEITGLEQWFSSKVDYPQLTFSNVWKHFSLSQEEREYWHLLGIDQGYCYVVFVHTTILLAPSQTIIQSKISEVPRWHNMIGWRMWGERERSQGCLRRVSFAVWLQANHWIFNSFS